MQKKKPTPNLRNEAAAAVIDCGANQIRLAARQITRFLDEPLRATGLSIEQFNLLTEIAAATDDSLAALATATCIEISTLSRNLRKLETKGWVEIASPPAGSRRRLVWLTEAGALQLAKSIPVWRDANKKLLRKIDIVIVRKLAAGTRRLKFSSS